MSSIASLFNVPESEPERATWGFAHAAHHRDINRLVWEIFAVTLPEFVLDPFDPANSETWAYQHQLMHTYQNAFLGIAGFNLTEVDWQDRNLLSGWIWLNAQEHYQAASILGIG